ncbi:hypothetical protein FRC00_008869, partial [Tulasnella sp. 408]
MAKSTSANGVSTAPVKKKVPKADGTGSAKGSDVEMKEKPKKRPSPTETSNSGAATPMSASSSPLKAPSAHKTSPLQWTTQSNSGTTTPSVPPPAPRVHRPPRSVDEDYDEEGTEREDGYGAALMGSVPRRVPLPPRIVSNSRLESLLNGGSGGRPSRSSIIPVQ